MDADRIRDGAIVALRCACPGLPCCPLSKLTVAPPVAPLSKVGLAKMPAIFRAAPHAVLPQEFGMRIHRLCAPLLSSLLSLSILPGLKAQTVPTFNVETYQSNTLVVFGVKADLNNDGVPDLVLCCDQGKDSTKSSTSSRMGTEDSWRQ